MVFLIVAIPSGNIFWRQRYKPTLNCQEDSWVGVWGSATWHVSRFLNRSTWRIDQIADPWYLLATCKKNTVLSLHFPCVCMYLSTLTHAMMVIVLWTDDKPLEVFQQSMLEEPGRQNILRPVQYLIILHGCHPRQVVEPMKRKANSHGQVDFYMPKIMSRDGWVSRWLRSSTWTRCRALLHQLIGWIHHSLTHWRNASTMLTP